MWPIRNSLVFSCRQTNLTDANNWFKHIYFITSIHSTYTHYITGGLGWKQTLIRTFSNANHSLPN